MEITIFFMKTSYKLWPEVQWKSAISCCVFMFNQVTMVIVFAILILATAVPDIQVVMSFGGSLGGTFIAFMPLGSFNLQLFHPGKKMDYDPQMTWPAYNDRK
jgi:hypothetical protein